MRIRKRQVPLPLSSLSPVPLSDPNLLSLNHCSSSPPLVQPPQQQQPHIHHDPKPSQRLHDVGPLPPQPSDHPNRRLLPQIGASSNDCSGSDFCWELKKRNYCAEALKGEDEDGSRDEGEKKGNDTRKGSILGAETVSGFASESSCSSHRVLGRWFEGEKAFPFKKRRGSIGEATRVEKEKKFTHTKMEKKSSDGLQQSDDKKQDDRVVTGEGINQNVVSGTSPKKRARGNAIMEGSRCSRVNGRGWRCCQQTLVGYSLCEHHLGKGRLRSLNSVRSRSLASSIGSVESKSKQLSRQSYLELPKDDDCKPDMLLDVNHGGEHQRQQSEHSEEKMPLVVTKKRMKLGTVKARSMSSLLGQMNSATAVEDENNK
ncbi:PREDICTED: uncharacterized protein LOC101307552 [Fragaria vesca subsp. vesca]|uniref:uncharacterized protein LOC101307552 n=1 Tax=Fragaria vesca subsp. vesca TaxID=101020 RepID=UPI0002C2F3F7|nr:PREDICTED: uncharacterized protein LOC101307552 [Fragaria vesca subsp. vesca]